MSEQKTHAEIIEEMRTKAECAKPYDDGIVMMLTDYADCLDAAHKREVEATAAKCCQLGRLAGYGASEIKHQQESVGNAAKLPDGWKMYDKYQIRHTDGTPLKGKRYFVLRLDSDDPLEAARVAAAMSAYKGETPQGNAVKMREAMRLVSRVAEQMTRGTITGEAPTRKEVDDWAMRLCDIIGSTLA